MVDVPVESYWGPAEKVNITLPGRTLRRIDEYARAHGQTRSGFLAEAARQAMR
jgi:metal-responsive CopG/Arc/MetJ family transcriptional regulator